MKQFIINAFIIFFISLVIWSVTNYSYQKKFDSLEVEKNICKEQLTEKKQPILTLSDAAFVIKREKELESVIKSPLYFNAKVQKLIANQWTITIELVGAVDGAADAADLKVNLPDDLTASSLKTGTAFPLYPRKVVDANYLLVTGLASPDNNKMVYGKPNKIFAEFTVSASDNQTSKKQIVVNEEDTKIYLNGESVLDTIKSVKLIDLP